MKSAKWVCAVALTVSLSAGTVALAQGHGHGNKDKGEKGKDKSEKAERKYYKDRDRAAVRGWYAERQGNLPPGLARKDRLPPGLERQLVERGSLPPGLQQRIQPVPQDLEVRLPPPPPECEHVFVGGNLVLLNRRTNIVIDIFHF